MVMNMKFKRILYFLPVRGPLQRASGVLQLELRVLTHYFGLSIIKKIVFVATNTEIASNMPEEEAFPKKARDKTTKFICKSLNKMFPEEQFQSIPLIYISPSETCESILDKVDLADVDPEEIQLELRPDTCSLCAKRVGIIKSEKVVYYLDRENKIPYDESQCHPKLIPDNRLKHKVANFFIQLFTLGHRSLKDFYLFDEICAGCRRAPGATRGCMKVGSKFLHNEEEITVDHKCNMLDAEEKLLPTPSAAEPSD